MVDLSGLNEFVSDSAANRDISPFFSGRTDIFDELVQRAQTVKRISERAIVAPGGFTTIVQGCPGIGKTSLMQRFVALCNEDFHQNQAEGNKPLPLIVRLSEALDIKSVVDKAVRSDPSNRAVNWLTSLGEDLMRSLKLSSTFDNFLDTIKPSIKGRPLVIFVDEIQNATERNRAFLEDLHAGAGNSKIGVLPVYFGLNSSRSRLENLALSRLGDNAVIHLGLLETDDCKHSFHLMLEEFGIRKGELTDEWIDVMVQESQNFPHHLTAALRASAVYLIENQGSMTREALGQARAQAEMYRHEFYENRVGSSLSTPRVVVGEVSRYLQENPEFLGKDTLEATNAVFSILSRVKHPSASFEVAQEITTAMIHRGILQLDPRAGSYTIPIPSFQTWAIQNL